VVAEAQVGMELETVATVVKVDRGSKMVLPADTADMAFDLAPAQALVPVSDLDPVQEFAQALAPEPVLEFVLVSAQVLGPESDLEFALVSAQASGQEFDLESARAFGPTGSR
jgi:hypothetical protein